MRKILSLFAVLTLSVGLWAVPKSTTDYYLVGYLNGANSGCEEDYESLHEEYKFVDGTLTTTFTEKSYVFVKTSDNSHWYLAESYIESAATVEAVLAEGKSEKVGVNANVEVTFTLTENKDGTLTLSYEEAAAPAEALPKITEAPKSWAGEYVITAMKDDNTAWVWTGVDVGKCRVEASVVDNKLTNDNFVKVVVEALADGGYSVKVKGGEKDGKYITQGTTPEYKNALKFVDKPIRVDIEMNDKGLVDIYQTINATQKVYLLYNATSGDTNERFRFYKDSNYGQKNYYSLTLFGTVASQPEETKYYAKNNWDGAAADNWTWKEMSATNQENVYMLDSVVFGGTGVNINNKEEDATALWFAAEDITVLGDGEDTFIGPVKRDTVTYAAPRHTGIALEAPKLQAGDTIKLIFYAADSTLKAFVIGRPEAQPVEEGFGIILSDGTTIKGQKNEAQQDFLEYIIVAELNANATFQLYDFATETAWTETNIDEASTKNLTINTDGVYEVTETGKYTIYLKMYGPENNQVYCGFEGQTTSLDKVKGQSGQRYNILGQPVGASYRGFVIMNGQTFLQK